MNIKRRPKTGPSETMRVGGVFKLQCIAPDGKIKWEAAAENLVNNTALTALLATMFNGATQVAQANWYLGLTSATPVPAATDTIASHSGWAEVTNYSQSARPDWGQGAAATESITNSAPVSFSINATVTVGGAFLVGGASGANTIGGTAGLLFSAAAFEDGNRSCVSGDTVNVTYTLDASA